MVLIGHRKEKRDPPLIFALRKKRALLIYGKGDTNAWNTPLMGEEEFGENVKANNESIDLTKEDTATSASTDTISQLTQDLAFLRKEFNESIKITNTKRDDKNTEFIAKISEIQKRQIHQ